MAVTPTTWNPDDMAAGFTLSNGNLTVTAPNSDNTFRNVRSIFGASSGKYYWEIHIDMIVGGIEPVSAMGIATSAVSLTAQPYPSDFAWMMQDDNGGGVCIKYNDTAVTNLDLPSLTTGDIGMIALDLDAGKIWFGRQGTWADGGNPSAGTGAQFTNVTGTVYALANLRSATLTGIAQTANFGATAFAYTVPTGFNAGFGGPAWTITASAGVDGTISPSGAVTVYNGENQSFAISSTCTGTVATSFIKDVLVDSASVGRVASYAFTNVTADHTIAASFLTWPDAEAITVITREIINETTPAHFTDAMILEWTNEAIRDIAIKTSCIEAIVAAATTSGSRLVPFAGHKVRYVEYLPDSGNRVGLQHITPKMLGKVPANIRSILTPTTWNGDDKHVNLVLSGADLTATTNAFEFQSVRSAFGISTGDGFYWEITARSLNMAFGPTLMVGVGTSAFDLELELGLNDNGWAFSESDLTYHNGSVVYPVSPGFSLGSTVMVAVKLPKIWWGVNGIWLDSGNPAAGTGAQYTNLAGTIYAVACMRIGTSGDPNEVSQTANFGATPFVYPVPAGFNAGLGTVAARRVPQHWFQWGTDIVIEPEPTAAYNLNLYISQWPDYLMSDLDDEPLISEGFQILILAFVLFKTYLRDRKFKTAAFCYKMYVAGINEIKALRIKRAKDKASDIALPDMVLGRGQNVA